MPKNLGRGLPLPLHPQIDQIYTVCEKWTKNLGRALPPSFGQNKKKTATFFRETFPKVRKRDATISLSKIVRFDVPERSVTPHLCLPVKPASFSEHIQGKLEESPKFIVSVYISSPVELFPQICG